MEKLETAVFAVEVGNASDGWLALGVVGRFGK